MRRMVFSLIFLLVLTGLVFGEKVVTLEEIMNPQTVTIDKDRMFITQGAQIFIYSLMDFKIQKTLGRKGDGPEEFKLIRHIDGLRIECNIRPDYIFVYSLGKISYFTREGKFIKELRVNPGSVRSLNPRGKHFVGLEEVLEDGIRYIATNIYDPDIKKIKEVYRMKSRLQKSNKFSLAGLRTSAFQIYDNKIFVENNAEGIINAYDNNGDKLFSLNLNEKCEKIKITEDHKQEYHNYYKRHPVYKRQYEIFKTRIEFPEYFPAIRNYWVADKKIYVRTYKNKDGKSEFILFNIVGKFLRKVLLPIVDKDINNPYPFTIYNGKIYQLIENEENEIWKLHVTGIK